MPCYDSRDNSPEASRSANRAEFAVEFRHNSPVAELLCAVMKKIHPRDRVILGQQIPGLAVWWDEHQKRDAEKEKS